MLEVNSIPLFSIPVFAQGMIQPFLIAALQTAQISGISIEINILTEFSMFYLPKILVLKASARSAPLAKNGYSKHIHFSM